MSNIINTNSSARTLTIPNLVNGQIYRARVSAVNNYGQGPFANWIQVTPSEFSVDNDFYNVELLLNMDQTADSDNYYGNSSLILSTPGLENTDDPYSVQTKLLLHGDGIAIVDSSLNPKSISRVNGPYTVSDSQFGTGSIRFTGNNYLSMGSSNDFSVGTGDFTVELFIKFKSFNTHNPICNSTNDINGADSSKWYINYAPGTGLYIGQHSSSNSVVAAWSASVDTWYHLAITRASGIIKIFINGIEQSVTDATILNNVNFNQSGFLVGRVTSSSGLDAQIEEFRFTKGVARNITVPTVAYPNPTSPFKDLSGNSKNVIVIGQPLRQEYSDAPPAPTNIVPYQASGTNTLRLDWSHSVYPIISDYIIQYSSDGGITWNTVNDGVSSTNNVVINNLADGFYIFRVAALNSIGQSDWTNIDITMPLPTSVEYLVVAGGGGGGNDMGGGGGGGGLITNVAGAISGGGSTAESTLYLENVSTLNIVVGAGGSGAAAGSGGAGTNGGNSIILVEGSDPYFNNVSLLMHMDGDTNIFIDSSSTPKNITAYGNATQSSVQSKWGGKSAAFDASSALNTNIPFNSSTFGTGDFVIEGWFYVTSISNYQWLYGARASNIIGGVHLVYYNNTWKSELTLDGSSWSRIDNQSIPLNQWFHHALVRRGSTLSAYVDGVRQGNISVGTGAFYGDNGGITLFSSGSSVPTGNATGYADDFRITIGSNREYIDETITVPTEAFPNRGSLVTALGGGYGASKHDNNSWNANNGGSGGGGSGGRQSGSSYGGLPGNGTTKQGFSGASSGPQWYPGGGGGAGGAGIGNAAVRGHGGPGVLSSILGTAYYWAGGGGGSGYSTTGGDGGIGGGGGGAVNTTVGGAGINNGSAGGGGSTNNQTNTPGGNGGANTGGGGGGGSHYNSNNYGGSGGSGAVILRSLTSATSTTGSPTVSTNGLYNIYMFTGTGSISFPSVLTVPPPPKNIITTSNSQGDLILSWDTLASSYNVTDYVIEYSSNNGSSWTTVSDGVSSSTGTTISGLADGNYIVRVAAVNSVGQGPWRATFVTLPLVVVNYLVIAGGGGGGGAVRGGGGGAGGYRSSVQGENSGGGAIAESRLVASLGTAYTVVVGAGGPSGPWGINNEACAGTNGNNSSFGSILSIGGGAGGASDSSGLNRSPTIGGSGGGGWYQHGSGGSGTSGQGYSGGTSSTSPPYGAGGGGAGGQGGNAQSGSGGFGGVGIQSNITGTPTYRAGGGSSSTFYGDSNYAAGNGGGGIGRNDGGTPIGQPPSNGTSNTGGGGGASGNGGSGVVILRCSRPAASTTGSPTITTDGNDTIYTFTDSGTITF